MVETYWNVGKRIVDEEQSGNERADYGSFLIRDLSKQLAGEFGKGFSEANLRNFRQFYLTFPNAEIRYAVRSGLQERSDVTIPPSLRKELTWSHYRLLMRVENINARQYYLNEAAEQNWSTRVLERNINTFYYERLLSSQNKHEALQQSGQLEKQSPADFIKDPYIFEFLNIPQPYNVNEQQIETALITNLQQFLLELGKGFSLVSVNVRLFPHPPQSRLITIKGGTDAETKIRGYIKFRLEVTALEEMIELALGAGLVLYNAYGMGCVEVV
jgi:predicted nuclease of restriction endonuclease-like (RecB) superfamily